MRNGESDFESRGFTYGYAADYISVQRSWGKLNERLTLTRLSDAIAAKERSVLHQLRD